MNSKPINGTDYYVENGFIVFTEKYHLQRGKCCGSKCRHCPFEPKHKKGSTTKKKLFEDNKQ